VLHVLTAFSVAAGLLAGAVGVGALVLRAVHPARLYAPGGWLLALGMGSAVQAVAASVLLGVGAFGTGAAAGVLAASLLSWLRRPAVPFAVRPGWVNALALVALLAPAGLAALSPPIDTDEMYQHLALARHHARYGVLAGGFDWPDGSRPQVVHALLATAFALGGAEAARLWHLGLTVALLVGAAELGEARFGAGRGWVPALVCAASYSFTYEAGLAYNDVPAALWLLLAAEGALAGGGSRSAVLFGLMAGFAVTAKYTAVPAAVGVGLLALSRAPPSRHERFRWLGLALAAGCVVVLPWWARNVVDGLHPLFPYAGWPLVEGFRFLYPEKYGVGHTWIDALLLPFNVLFRAKLHNNQFLGQLSWGWLVVGLGLAWEARRNADARWLLGILTAAFVAWGASAQVIRYLVPLAGVAVLAGAASRARGLAVVALAASAPQNLGPLWTEAGSQWMTVGGELSEDRWLRRELPAWGALRHLREHAPPDATVAQLYAWHGYWIDQPWILGSVEEHTPTRFWLARHGDDALRALRARGVNWLLVGDVRFLRRQYTFLSEADWTSQFVAPRDRLTRLLARDATRVYVGRRWEVYRLDVARVGD
jgi:hypothetical protein